MSVVHLNGQYLPKEDAFVSVDDRGFLFGDGIYEVTAIYRGNLFPAEMQRIDGAIKRGWTWACRWRLS